MSQWKSLYAFLPDSLNDLIIYNIYLFLKPREYLYNINLLDNFYIYKEYSLSSAQSPNIKASIFYIISQNSSNYSLELVFNRYEHSFEYQHLFILNQSKYPLNCIKKKIALNFHYTYFSLSNNLSIWERTRWNFLISYLIFFLNHQFKNRHLNDQNNIKCMNCGHICFYKKEINKNTLCQCCQLQTLVKSTTK